MTIPFTPDGENPFPTVGSMDGMISGAAFSALNNRTQANVTAMLQQQLTGNNNVWEDLWDVFIGFIRQPIDWVVNILKKLFPWIDWAGIPTNFNNMLTWIVNAVHAIPFFGNFIQGVETFVQALIRNIIEWVSNPGDVLSAIGRGLLHLLSQGGEVLKKIIEGIIYWITHPGEPGGIGYLLIEGLKTLFTNGGAIISTIINSIIYWLTHPGEPGGIGYLLMEALKSLFTNGGAIISTVISSIVYWLQHPGDLVTGVIDFLKGVFAQGGALIGTVVNSIIYWIQHPGQPGGIGYLLMEALKGLFVTGGDLVGTIINTISYWFNNAGTLLTALTTAVINWLKSIGIDLTGGLSFMQVIVDNIARFFGQTGATLWSWANNIVTNFNIFGIIQGLWSSLFANFPISMVNTQEKVNLLNMGIFQTSSSLENSGAWSWDSTKNRTGTIGGTAKTDVTKQSGTRTLYSNQNVRVTSGDRIAVSAWINTSGFNGDASSIQLKIISFDKTSKVAEDIVAYRGPYNVAGQWVELTNASTPLNIGSTVTSVQMALVVNSSATAGSVWWDDITLWKTGLMKQGLVEYLLSAWNGLIGGLSVTPNATPTPTNRSDPWNFTLQAGAAAATNANNALTNAGTAKDAADGAATEAGKAKTAAEGAAGEAGKAKTAADDATKAAGEATTAAGGADTKATTADYLAVLSSSANSLVIDPDFEDTRVRRYWQPQWSTAYADPPEPIRSGIHSLKITVNTTTSNIQVLMSPLLLNGSATEYPVVPGQVYKFDVWVQAKSTNSSSGSMAVAFNLWGASASGFSHTGGSATPAKGTWQRITGSFTIPTVTGASNVEPHRMVPAFVINNAVAGDVYYLDRWLIYT